MNLRKAGPGGALTKDAAACINSSTTPTGFFYNPTQFRQFTTNSVAPYHRSYHN